MFVFFTKTTWKQFVSFKVERKIVLDIVWQIYQGKLYFCAIVTKVKRDINDPVPKLVHALHKMHQEVSSASNSNPSKVLTMTLPMAVALGVPL